MGQREISEAEIQAVVTGPDRHEDSRGTSRKYFKQVGVRELAVVMAHDVEPPYVVTVMIVE
jgi:hypothetical protein